MKIVVDAIRYCHEMNVVHRDIKVPSIPLILIVIRCAGCAVDRLDVTKPDMRSGLIGR